MKHLAGASVCLVLLRCIGANSQQEQLLLGGAFCVHNWEGRRWFDVATTCSIGITFGNEFNLSERLYLGLEFYYYNNKLVLASEGANRFELHQCLGGSLKPGIRYGRHSSFLILGINGVYLFDKNEMTEIKLTNSMIPSFGDFSKSTN